MEQAITQLNLRWNLLRTLILLQVTATTLLILATIPEDWLALTVPVVALGFTTATLTALQLKQSWAWLTLLAQAFLFCTALMPAILGITGESYMPILLLAFTMMIASEHGVSLILKYAAQFSRRQERSTIGFNLTVLQDSLRHLYRKLTVDALVFGIGFILSLSIATLGTTLPMAGFLSDPSLYAVVASLSIALLIVLKGENTQGSTIGAG